jgi:outer membrane lipoprotein LolB
MLGLAACSSLPRENEQAAGSVWATRKQALEGLREWTLRGRISVQNDAQAWAGTVYWKQRGDAYDVRLIAPLGQGTVWVQGDPTGVSLRLPSGERRAAQAPEDLLASSLGLRLPLLGLVYWVRGLPEPNRPMRGLWDAQGRLSALDQGGWAISYRGYVRDGAYDLPEKVFLDSGSVSVRLLVERWKTG